MQEACGQPSAVSTSQRAVIANQVLVAKLWKQASRFQVPCPIPNEWMPHLAPKPIDAQDKKVMSISTDPEAGFSDFKIAWVRKVQKVQRDRQEGNEKGKMDPSRSPPIAAAQPQETLVPNTTTAPHVVPPATTLPGSEPQPTLSNDNHQPEKQQDTKTTLVVRQGPLFIFSGHPPVSADGQRFKLETDVAELVRSERDRIVTNRKERYLKMLQEVCNDPNAHPGMKYRSDQMPFGLARLHLRLLNAATLQKELQGVVYREGKEISSMTEKQYKSLLKLHRNTRIETVRKDLARRTEIAANRAREVKAFRSDYMNEINQGVKDLRTARNRAVTRAHERLARERSRSKDDDRALRLAALKAHDFEAYQEMLKRQTGSTPAAGERYEAISKFLADTEAYLHRLATKIASVKISAEASSAVSRAVADARARGLSEEEVEAAARAAATDAANGNEALRAAADGSVDAQTRYYQLAHSNAEEITDQPRLLRPPNGASLREYQIVGLQWMVSLYNNHLNGILADEMGLGKTVQVLSLIAYLMEKKANYGPHLIIVPNAVIVNWKSELTQWLPSARCIYYVGSKDERARKYVLEVQPLQFNVLVTTYEFIMRDRSKLSKIDWQYIIIDEAQRMKDRQSKLAKDLDRFTAARRLLLSGTPLQNDLRELWSLLNLLLPDVFDDKKIFADWFGNNIGDGNSGGSGDDWLEKEKRVVVIHRLHQILEPFMLRRQVEDVESKLPRKLAYTIKVPMSAHQSMVYTWVKATGTIRLDPEAPRVGSAGRARREYAGLQNKCMELRKLCNHPMLSYPPAHWGVGDAIVRQCGKMVTLDRMLVKLKASGHRVLLFSTMTRLLDLLEVYLQWRELPAGAGGGMMSYLRIDGSTSLEDRETAIRAFNAPESNAFIFLLSIRAAGRGLNLQSSDTVVIYDPDPNPKNEEQAIARSHRIGQKKEVRVFHLEAVTDAPPQMESYDKNSDVKVQRHYYGDSIESIVRGQIQQLKIEMANEVIDAGRFDQRTTMAERRQTLEALLQDQERNRKATNEVPSYSQINRMMARSDDEVKLFDKLDEELNNFWLERTLKDEVPSWMRWNEAQLRAAMEENNKHKVNIEFEMAALTGTVLHHTHPHHHVGLEVSKVVKSPQKDAMIQKDGLPKVEITELEPAMTTTTTLSAARSMGDLEEEEEVAMADNDEEEEEVLDQNILTDEDDGKSEGADGGSAAKKSMNGKDGLVGSDKKRKPEERQQEEQVLAPPPKRNRVLSVHFEDDVVNGASD